MDGFSARYGDLLFGGYDCVDRVVLNAYNTLCYSPGGFRTWWRACVPRASGRGMPPTSAPS